jgi:hypothetical protein
MALEKILITLLRSQAILLIQSLNDNKVEEWKSVVLNENWVGLITHYMCLAHF